MKKINVILASLILFGLMTGCGGNTGGSSNNTNTSESAEVHGITMTVKAKDEVKFQLSVNDNQEVSIDWGDGSPVETFRLKDPSIDYWVAHNYAQPAEYTIKITGENIRRFNNLLCILTTLDVSNNPALTDLYCSESQLKTLDVSKNTALETLWCSDNQLTSLDVSKNTALESLNCNGNQLTTLDVSKNTALRWVHCQNNQLTSLTVGKGEKIDDIDCVHNKLSAAALNELFSAVCVAVYEQEIEYMEFFDFKCVYIGDNPGTKTCDRTIAEKKDWRIANFGD